MTREEISVRIIEAMDSGELDPRFVAHVCLMYMTKEQLKRIAQKQFLEVFGDKP